MKLGRLLLTSAVVLLAAPAPDPGTYVRSDGEPCPLEGSAKDLPRKMLNRHKNRFTGPDASHINAGVTLAAMLEPPGAEAHSDEDRFDPEQGATVTGFVVDVKSGGCAPHPNGKGGESCNCNATVAVDCDTHIEVALSSDAPENQRVIVEVTPRLRKQMRDQGKDWSTAALKNEIKGQWVQFTGWLLFDFEHAGEAENTSPGNPKNWRATCWEVHPVTDYKVLGAQPTAVRVIAPADLKARHQARAKHVEADPQLKKRISEHNNALGVLYREEGEEGEVNK